jgi:hypothetical protein
MAEILGTGRALLPVFWLAGGRGGLPGQGCGAPCWSVASGRRAGCGHAGYVCRGPRSIGCVVDGFHNRRPPFPLLARPLPTDSRRFLPPLFSLRATQQFVVSTCPAGQPRGAARDKWPMLSGHRLRVFPRRPARAVVTQRPVGRCVTVARPSSTRRCFFSLAFCCSSTSSLSRMCSL